MVYSTMYQPFEHAQYLSRPKITTSREAKKIRAMSRTQLCLSPTYEIIIAPSVPHAPVSKHHSTFVATRPGSDRLWASMYHSYLILPCTMLAGKTSRKLWLFYPRPDHRALLLFRLT